MTGDEIRAAVVTGMSPRELNERVRADHREQIETEIAAGKWPCRSCGKPMKLKPDTSILFCDREHGDNA